MGRRTTRRATITSRQLISTNNIATGMVRGSQVCFQSTENMFSLPHLNDPKRFLYIVLLFSARPLPLPHRMSTVVTRGKSSEVVALEERDRWPKPPPRWSRVATGGKSSEVAALEERDWWPKPPPDGLPCSPLLAFLVENKSPIVSP
jgi:hypothetical protein